MVFIRVPFSDFVLLEDTTHLDSQPYFSKLTKTNILDIWKRPYLNYMPLTYSIWAIAAHLTERKPLDEMAHSKSGVLKDFRFSPVLFHILPLTFHLMTAFLLFWLFCFLTHHPLGSFLGALLFAIHPIQVESVAWVSSLKDTLSGFLGVLSIFIFILAQESPPKSKTFKFFIFSSTCAFFLSLCSAPSAIAIPLITLLICFYFYKRERFQYASRFLLGWGLLTIPFFVFQYTSSSNQNFLTNLPPLKEQILVSLDSLSFYFSKIILPLHLAVDYGRNTAWVLTQTAIHTTASIFFVFIFALTLFLKWNKMKWALACEAIFLAGLIPTFLFQRLLFQPYSSVADKDLYLSMIAVGLAVAFITKQTSKKPAIALGFMLILIFFGTRSFFQTFYWKDTPHLLNHALEINSESALAHNTLGHFYEKMEDYNKAVSHFTSALILNPESASYHRMGAIHLAMGNFSAAKTIYEKALLLHPLSSVDFHGLGLSWMGLGNKAMAQDNFAKASALSPRDWASSNAVKQLKRDLFPKNKTAKNHPHRKTH